MSDIKLNFINRSNDRNNSRIVIYQRNEATDFESLAVAWKIIENCGQGWSHLFMYPMAMFVSASDSWGNVSPKLPVENGQQYQVVDNKSGDFLRYFQNASSPNEVEVVNSLNMGAISASIYKDGRLLATKTGVAPSQKAVFELEPTIWIGVASQIEEGQLINTAVESSANTPLSIFGIKSADIVMTGGGSGAGATAFQFSLQNVEYA